MAKPVYNNQQIINQIDSGWHWTSGGSTATSITYGITTNSSWFPSSYSEYSGWSALNGKQAAMTSAAIEVWDDVIASNIIASSDPNSSDIRFSNSSTGVSYAHAYYPGATGTDTYSWEQTQGSVWFNPSYTSLTDPDVGEYGFMAIIHEIGHTLGLNHPGTYNGGSPTYANDALYAQDTHQYTVMSYFNATNTGADWWAGNGQWYYAQTPMVHDILVAQSIYGADTTTRSGDTVYGFNATADNAIFDFTQNVNPVLTIWDGGGTDTLDLSGWNTSSIISLIGGSFSHANSMTYNIAIAYGAEIENATGGGGTDTITGNALDNVLRGLGGDDTLTGGGGNDWLYGGAETDTAVFSGALSTYSLVSYGGTTAVITFGGDGADRLAEIENLQFVDQTVGVNAATQFDALGYIASYTDLINAFGTNAQVGFNHYVDYGFGEGRGDTFDGLEYIASYGDLINALGANADMGATHFIYHGLDEGRTTTFDPQLYLGGFEDLRTLFGTDQDAATTHFIENGFGEGRDPNEFNALEYIASYGDLIGALGADATAGLNHFFSHGFGEGRSDTFDGLEYIASYGDLINALGANADIGATHFIYHGLDEGRTTTFDPSAYLNAAGNADLLAAFGADLDAATIHYIDFGFDQGRATANLDAIDLITDYNFLEGDDVDLTALFTTDLNNSDGGANDKQLADFVRVVDAGGGNASLEVDADGGADNFAQVATLQGITAGDMVRISFNDDDGGASSGNIIV